MSTRSAARSAFNRLARLLVGHFGAFFLEAGGPIVRVVSWDYLRRRRSISDATVCLRLLLPNRMNVAPETVRGYFEELARCDALRESVEKYEYVTGKDFHARLSRRGVAAGLFCYVLTRIVEPEIVVETGCAAGWTSALFLAALHRNQKGRLFSIDIPPVAGQLSMNRTLPEGLQPGFLVPEGLKARWTLILGNARVKLIPLLERNHPVDIFYSDSDHTYQHMMWEYASVWPYLSKHGQLISDDIGWNTAFWDFATAMRRPFVVHRSNTNFGALSYA